MAIDFSTRVVRSEQPAPISVPVQLATAPVLATERARCHRDNCNCGLEHGAQATVSSTSRCQDCGTVLSAENKSTKSGMRCDDCYFKLMDTVKGVIQARQAERRPKPPDDPLAFPEECLADDRLGDMAKDMRMPLGLAYPAVLACASAKPNFERMCGARLNLYCALIVKPGGGKNEAIRRALTMMELIPGLDYKMSAPGGDAQLVSLLGDRASGKKGDRERIPGPKKMLLVCNEIGDMLRKTGIDNSTLASRMCDFWDCSEYDKPTGKNGEVTHVDCRISWLGGLPASVEQAEKFSELFGGETNFGLYPRFIYGYSGVKFNFRDWEVPSKGAAGHSVAINSEDDAADALANFSNNDVKVVHRISNEAMTLYDAWEPGGDHEGRLKYNAKKIAILKACFNGEDVVTAKRMQQAITFMEWQIRIRETFKPGVAKETNREAWFTEHLIPALERAGACKQFVSWRRISLRNHWDERIDAGVQIRTVENLVMLGRLIEEPEDEDESKKRKSRRQRKFPHVMLRTLIGGES
jgi:DNA-directed RNA polymerase subunit RPC12/RpoP